MSEQWVTRRTLLQRAQDPDDQKAWDDFVAYYKSFIDVILYKMSFRISDKDDVTQIILVKIWKYLSKFDKDKKVQFRTWLGTLIRNEAINYINSNTNYQRRQDMASKHYSFDDVASQPELDALVQAEWEQHLTMTAFLKVKTVFSGAAIKAFEMSLEGASAKEIGSELNINQESVRTLKNRVKKKLIQEIDRLRNELEF